jgi:hypothetical protein
MDGVKLLLIMLYCVLGGAIFYILSRKDCKASMAFLKLLFVLLFIEAAFIFSYDTVCDAGKSLFCS